VIGKCIAGETGAEKLALDNSAQRPFGGEAGGIRRSDPTASRAEPSNSIFRVRDNSVAMIGRDRLPQIEFRLHGHPTIVSRVCSLGALTAQKVELSACNSGSVTRHDVGCSRVLAD
jgi:hypothetical protein